MIVREKERAFFNVKLGGTAEVFLAFVLNTGQKLFLLPFSQPPSFLEERMSVR